MRILVISNLFPPHVLGGYEIRCKHVSEGLAGRGHDVAVLTSDWRADAIEANHELLRIHRSLGLIQSFDRPVRGRMRRQRFLVSRRNFALTRAAIAEERPDVVFIWSQLRLGLGQAHAAQSSGIPVAYSLGDEHLIGSVPSQLRPTATALLGWLADRWIFATSTVAGLEFRHVACLSEHLKRNLIAKGLAIPAARVIYRGIPLDRFSPKIDPGSIHSPARILYVGQLHPYKGVHTLIEAAHEIAREDGGGGLQVSIVGTGPESYGARLRALAEGGPAAIRFLGHVAHGELPDVYREHDIFVFPSIWEEPFGVTHLEAMACGTPVISTTGGGQDECLEPNVNALAFPKEDARGLASCIRRLVGDEELRRRLSMAAWAMVQERFDLDDYVKAIEGFLEEAVRDHKARRTRAGVS